MLYAMLLACERVHSRFSEPLGCSDDVTHHGEKIDWGAWAITGDDPEFGGTGNADTGDDYGPAPGARAASPPSFSSSRVCSELC